MATRSKTRRLPRRLVAVDADSRQLRLAEGLRSGQGIRIRQVSSFALDEDVDPANPADLGGRLKEALGQMRLRGASILMTVPRGQVVLKPLMLPPGTPADEAAGMVPYQVAGELPFPLDEAVVDFAMEPHQETAGQGTPQTEGTRVVVGAVRLPVVDYYRQVASAAGAKLLGLHLRPHACAACLRAAGLAGREGNTALVHLMADEAEVDVLTGGRLAFSRSAVVKPPSASPQRSSPVNRDDVVREVARSLQSYVVAQRGEKIDQALVSGATGIEADVADALGRKLQADCRQFNPGQSYRLTHPHGAGAFVPALGLLSGSACDALPLDFLNPKQPPVRRNIRRIATVAAVVAGVVLLVAAGVARWSYLNEKRQRNRELAGQLERLKDQPREIRALARKVKNVEDWADDRRHWLDHWAHLHGLFPPAELAYVTPSGIQTGSRGSLSFTVRARDSKVIDELGRRLAQAGYEYQPGRVAREDDGLGHYPHSTEMRIYVDPKMSVEVSAVEPADRPADDMAREVFHAPRRRGRRGMRR